MTTILSKFIRTAWSSLPCIALIGIMATSLAAQAPPTSTLTVKITGIRSTTGNIRIALKTGETSVAQRKVVDIDPKTLTAVAIFENVPLGTYGVAVLHDENMNGQLDFDEQGVPLEGYGHSNNPSKRPSPPAFDETKFALNQPSASIEIALIYWP